MRFCANCGERYEKPSRLCGRCAFDPETPEGIADLEVGRLDWRRDDPRFGYPGERAALGLSIAIAIAIATVLGAASLGVFVVVVIVSLLDLTVAQVRLRKDAMTVTERNFAGVAKLAKLAAYRLRLRCPDVYVTQDPSYNAYTRGFARHGFIVVNSALVQDFTAGELLFILGHEMGHIKHFHATWLTLLSSAPSRGAGFLLAPLMQVIFGVWGVKCEYTTDQAGLIASGDVEVGVVALLKLGGGVAAGTEVDLTAIRETKPDEGKELSGLLEYAGTHPFTHNRVQHLLNYAASPGFATACSWK